MSRSYACAMVRRADEFPDDPVIVLIKDDDEPAMSFDEWLELVDGDEPTDVDLDAAGVLRDIRSATSQRRCRTCQWRTRRRGPSAGDPGAPKRRYAVRRWKLRRVDG